MIFLPRVKPFSLVQLEILLPRMHQSDPLFNKLNDKFYREKSGYIGEKSMDYFYNLLQLDLFPVLHGLRMKTGRKLFQMDTLILFPTFILIIEIKNLTGVINYHSETGLLFREKESGKLERFQDPMMQASIQRHHLQNFLQIKNISPIPIHTLSVFSNPNVVLKIPGQASVPDLLLAQQLLKRIPELQKQYQTEVFSINELEQIAGMLTAAHVPDETKIVDAYNIQPAQIIKGVWCTNCQYNMMIRINNNWRCEQCEAKDQFAHLHALREFCTIYGPQISNSSARTFLNLTSENTMKGLLKRGPFKQAGKTKGATYRFNDA